MTKLPIKRNLVMFLVLVAWVISLDEPVCAQTAFEAAPPDTVQTQGHMLGMILTGTAVGTLGFMTGAVIGVNSNDGHGDFDGLAEGLIIGSIVGGITLPLGVHIGNKSQGNLGQVMATSLAVGGAGWLIMWKAENGALLPIIPVAQLICCISVEQATTPQKISEERTERQPKSSIFVNLAPLRDGMGFFISGSF